MAFCGERTGDVAAAVASLEWSGNAGRLKICSDGDLAPNSPWNLVVHLFLSLAFRFFSVPLLSFLLQQCSGSPPSPLFCSTLSPSLRSVHRPVSPSTPTSTSTLSVSAARIGMLALKTSGLLVSPFCFRFPTYAGQKSNFTSRLTFTSLHSNHRDRHHSHWPPVSVPPSLTFHQEYVN